MNELESRHHGMGMHGRGFGHGGPGGPPPGASF
jgi:hypothetical protein